MSDGVPELLLNGGGGLALAILVHWHLGSIREQMATLTAGMAVLLDRVARGETAPAS